MSIANITLNKGTGEYDAQDLHSHRPTCAKRLRLLAFVSLITGIAVTIFGGVGTLVGCCVSAFITSSKVMAICMGTVAGSSLGLCIVAGFFIFLVSRKYRRPPSTHTLGLNAADHKAPALGEFHPNHTLIVTQDAQETWEWKLKIIRSVEQSLLISGNYCGGVTFRQALQEIGDRMDIKLELKLHLMASGEMLTKADIRAIEDLKKRHPERAKVLITNIRINSKGESVENHIKAFIGDAFVVGGGTSLQDMLQTKGDGSPPEHPPAHFSERLMGKASRDMDFVGKGDLSDTMRLEYFKLWAIWTYIMSKDTKLENHYYPLDPNKSLAVIEDFESCERKVENVELRFTVSSVMHRYNQIFEEFRRVISESEGDIRIRSLTFNPSKGIRKALIRKIKDGKQVEILTNGFCKNHAPISYNFAPVHLHSFAEVLVGKLWKKIRPERFQPLAECSGNVKICEYAVKDTMMHKKAMIAGGKKKGEEDILLITSANFSKKSEVDDEWAWTARSKPLVDRAKPIFDKDLAGSRELTPQKVRRMVRHPLRRLIAFLYQFLYVRFSG